MKLCSVTLVFLYILVPLVPLSSQNASFHECEENLGKKFNEYVISFNNHLYKDKDKAFICESLCDTTINNGGVQIGIFLKPKQGETLIPIVSSTWDWGIGENCECRPSHPQNHLAHFFKEHFKGDNLAKIKVKFKDETPNSDREGQEISLSLTIEKISKISIHQKKSNEIRIHEFDSNVYEAYPSYNFPIGSDNKKIPWKVFIDEDIEKLRLRNSRKAFGLDLQTITTNSEVVPTNVPSVDNIEFEESGSTLENFGIKPKQVYPPTYGLEIEACPNIEMLNADILDEKSIELNLFTLIESDDDILNFCIDKVKEDAPLANSNDIDEYLDVNCQDSLSIDHKCLLPGDDASFDFYMDTKIHINAPWLEFSCDSIVNEGTWFMHVYAGEDKKCDSRTWLHFDGKILDDNKNLGTRSKPLFIDSTPFFDYNLLNNNTNAILNKIGVTMDFIDRGKINFNFDIKGDDNDIVELVEWVEIRNVLSSIYGNNLMSNKNISKVYMVNNLEDFSNLNAMGERKGRSIANEAESIIDVLQMEERTLAHEIGHAMWGWYHPDEYVPNTLNDIPENLKYLVKDDPRNLMTSGSRGNGKVIDTTIRRYQWIKID